MDQEAVRRLVQAVHEGVPLVVDLLSRAVCGAGELPTNRNAARKHAAFVCGDVMVWTRVSHRLAIFNAS
jgi:hypothetical protein